MKYSCAKFERALRVPFRYGKKELASRKGIYLKEISDAGIFISEISPLPGHSKECLDDCLSHLANPRASEAPPAVRFARLGIAAQKKCLLEKITGRVESNALIPWASAQTIPTIASAISSGYTTIKLKVMPQNLNEILGAAQAATQLLPQIKIRLDANQALTKEEYFHLEDQISPLRKNIEYIEEPFIKCFESAASHNLNWAADESANSIEQRQILESSANPPALFIVKPQVMGELPTGKNFVVSSALETEAGRRSILAMLYLQPQTHCSGLSTGFLFQDNFLIDSALYELPLTPSPAEWKFYDSLVWEDIIL